jgi:hypothetical protein
MREGRRSSRLWEPTFPLYPRKVGYKAVWGLQSIAFVHRGSGGCCCGVDGPRRCRGVRGATYGCCLTSLQHWRLTARGCLLRTGLHQVKPSRGFLSSEGAPTQGADERARELHTSGDDGVLCLVVAYHQLDFVRGVGDSALRPLVGLAPGKPRALDARRAGQRLGGGRRSGRRWLA